jgi:predicted transcriptional regulator of viral defense system
MYMSGTLPAALLEVAARQHGLFGVQQAADVGVVDAVVRKLAARDVLERRAQGVYRIVAFPLGPAAEYMEAVLWAKGRGVIGGEAALVLWDLADVNPRRIDLIVPKSYRPRRQGGDLYRVRRADLAPDEVDEVDGVPVVTPAVAIRHAVGDGVGADFVEQAIRRAEARELIGRQTAARLAVALYDRGATPTKRATTR